ncbi:hypothetical protein HYN56_16195 [Flavobacterium crocinum]|uniref:Uncharacterized protein n=1 Tax=Flavobacterium crocinum TaxID=2183896 RepID=A0A2S1YNN0_9FLAO|nr:hypothetical protein [Flavobacterium crocinum]AWK05697.1 hypothetical protein HYN56_16195 [Flavobacterium crocinum]
METPATIKTAKTFLCTTRVHKGENDELIFVKSYQGDWGHWDDKIEETNPESDTYELDHFETE